MVVSAGVLAGVRATRRHQAAKRRVEYSDKKFQTDLQIMQIFAQYDTNRSKKLEPEQLRSLMRDLAVIGSGAGVEPTDDELRFVLTVADKRHNDAINEDEVLYAVRVWKNYMQDKELIDQLMAQYDTDKSGKLDKDQLKRFLIELNDNVPVSDEEVDWVFKKADVLGDGAIGGIELKSVVSAWNSHVEDKKISCCAVL